MGNSNNFIFNDFREVNRQTSRIPAHRDDVNAVSFVDETTHLLASGGDDGLVMVWDRRALRQEEPTPVGVLAGHSDGVTYIDPKMDGRHLISNSKDQSVKLWDIRRYSWYIVVIIPIMDPFFQILQPIRHRTKQGYYC